MKNLFMFLIFVVSTSFVLGQSNTSDQKGEPLLKKAENTSDKVEQNKQSAPKDKRSESTEFNNKEGNNNTDSSREPQSRLAAPNKLEKTPIRQ